jgi:hypothetical protein
MATVNGSIYFRVTGAPWEGFYEEVESALRKVILDNLTKEEQQKQQHHISVLPSCDPDDRTCVALVEFKDGVPNFLSSLIQKPLADWQVEMRDTDMTFDRHFFGFTQLYIPRGGHSVSAEYNRNFLPVYSIELIRRFQHYRYHRIGWTCLRFLEREW